MYSAFNLKGSIFDLNNPAEYRARKDLLKYTFSKTNIYNIEKLVQEKVGYLCETLKGYVARKERLLVLKATTSVTIDISTDFTAGHTIK